MNEYKILKENQNFLEKIDIFGIGINIRFNKQALHKTKIGGLVTLVIMGILAYLIKLIVDNLQDTQNPIVLFEQRFTAQPERYYLSQDKFIMAFGIQDSKSQHYIDPTIYQATLWIKKTVKTLNPTTNEYVANQQKRTVKIEPCRIDHFNIPDVNKYFTSLKYSKLLCISKEETDIFLEGQFDALQYSTLELIIESCLGANCHPDMNNILKLCRLAVYYVDYSVIPSDIKDPFQPLGRQSFWVSGPEFTKQTSITFKNSYLKSDYGIIGQDVYTDKALTFSGDREQVAPKTNNILFDCFIQFEKNIDSVYKRSYQKLDKSISQLGGIFNILFTIGALLCRPLSQIELNLKLINRLFQFEDKHLEEIQKKKEQLQQSKEQNSKILNSKDENLTYQDTQNQELLMQSEYGKNLKYKLQSMQKSEGLDNLNTSQINKNNNTNNNNNNNNNINNNININKNLIKISSNKDKYQLNKSRIQQSSTPILKRLSNSKDQVQKLTKSELAQIKEQQIEKEKQTNEMNRIFSFTKNKISFKGWEYYSNFFKFSYLCKNRKHQLLQKGVEKLYNQIDIFFLIQKMLEIEKLKSLLLNENQIKLFEFIPKPVLTLEEKKVTCLSDKVGILYEGDTDILQKAADARLAFFEMMNPQQKPSKIDLRILELLDPNIKYFLQGLGKDIPTDFSAIRNQISNIFDQQKQSQLAQKDNQDDDLKMATEEMPTKLYQSDITYSPRRTLNALYSSNTKPNHTQFINI